MQTQGGKGRRRGPPLGDDIGHRRRKENSWNSGPRGGSDEHLKGFFLNKELDTT